MFQRLWDEGCRILVRFNTSQFDEHYFVENANEDSVLCTWNVAYAQQAFYSTVVRGLPVQPTIQTADIGGGIVLHYVDQGKGTPLIFVHGSLSDGGYWADQIGPFAEYYRAIASSRPYNYPNSNPPRAGYSAVADAEDLAVHPHSSAAVWGKVVPISGAYFGRIGIQPSTGSGL